MGILDGLNDAKVYETGVFLQPDNKYKLRVEKILEKKTRKSGMCWIVETTVLESTCVKDGVGDKRTWLQKMDDAEIAFPAIKQFMYALLGYTWANDKEFIKLHIDPRLSLKDGSGLADQATTDANPFKGRVIGCDTIGTTTKGKGLKFTRHDFYPADTKLGQPVAA